MSGLKQHQDRSRSCLKAQRVNRLVQDDFVPCESNSPICQFVFFAFKDEPIWQYDFEDEPWIPIWFCELWHRANKSPVTGRLDCDYQSFLDSVNTTRKLEKRMASVHASGILRDFGWFASTGDYYRSDLVTPIWEVRKRETEGRFTKEDYNNVAGTLVKGPGFSRTRYQ